MISKQLILSQKLLELKMVENIDSADLVINELETHIEMLKGEYLQGIVTELRDIKYRIQICKKTKMC